MFTLDGSLACCYDVLDEEFVPIVGFIASIGAAWVSLGCSQATSRLSCISPVLRLMSLSHFLYVRLPHPIEVGVGEGVQGREALLGVHPEHAVHEGESLGAHLAHVLLLQGLRVRDL